MTKDIKFALFFAGCLILVPSKTTADSVMTYPCHNKTCRYECGTSAGLKGLHWMNQQGANDHCPTTCSGEKIWTGNWTSNDQMAAVVCIDGYNQSDPPPEPKDAGGDYASCECVEKQ